jgi:cytochrome c
MLTLALDSSCYIAYDLSRCTLYKAWKGGVTLEGAPYTDKKNVQPMSWGKAYFTDSLHVARWVTTINGKKSTAKVISKGYSFHNDQIGLSYEIRLATGDTIRIREQPEYIVGKNGEPGLERIFSATGIPSGVVVSLYSTDGTLSLDGNKTTRVLRYFEALPAQFPPKQEAEYDHRGIYFM